MARLFCVLTFSAALFAAVPIHADDDQGYKLLDIDGHVVKWGAPHLGTGAVVTWRLSFARATAEGRENCRRTVGLDGMLHHAGLSREDALRAADAAFALWSKAANIRFAPAAAGAHADITIAAEAEADGIAYSDVAPDTRNDGHVTSLLRSIVCLNPETTWTMAPQGTYRLTYVLAHEIGHAIGLDHPSPTGALMSFEYDAARDGLTQGDIAGAQALYGSATRVVSAR